MGSDGDFAGTDMRSDPDAAEPGSAPENIALRGKNAASLPPAILLMGPTACGKSALAIELAERLGCEIISVDSAQIYRHMDIGTAKPDAAERGRVPHHLIDIIDPHESYSAARFRDDALTLMREIVERGRIPLLAGGTMLYFRALTEGLNDLPEADAAMRLVIDTMAEDKGWPALHAELARIDPESASRIQPNDAQRIQRALEIYYLAGKSMEYGYWYHVGLAAAAVFFLYQQYLIRDRKPAECFAAFLNNHYVGLSVFIGILLEYAFRLPAPAA